MENFLKYLKEYLYFLRRYILLACLIFIFAVFSGYFSAQNSPSQAQLILETLREMLEPVGEMSAFNQFLFIVLNNGFTLFLVLLLGLIFGIFPFLVLLSNGTILGVLAHFSKTAFSWQTFFMGTIPHGIIEIPVVILACAIGFKLGKTSFERIFKKQGSVKTELNAALNFFLKILLPLLILAAAIEVFITSQLL